jgi:hypothetical protein
MVPWLQGLVTRISTACHVMMAQFPITRHEMHIMQTETSCGLCSQDIAKPSLRTSLAVLSMPARVTRAARTACMARTSRIATRTLSGMPWQEAGSPCGLLVGLYLTQARPTCETRISPSCARSCPARFPCGAYGRQRRNSLAVRRTRG